MTDINWNRYPSLAQVSRAKTWLQIQANLCLAPNTIEAYGRALEDFLSFSNNCNVIPDIATKEHIAKYVRDLTTRPNPRYINSKYSGNPVYGLANATLQQKLTAVRLYYDYLMEEGLRSNNPVGRGKYTPGKTFGGQRERGLIPRYTKLPWIPTGEQWQSILEAMKGEPLRNRVMLAFSYDAALRREELCSLRINDIDPCHRTLTIRAEITKNHLGRVVPYSEATSVLYSAYLRHRRNLSHERGNLFLSESRRNYAQPISIWTWSKVVKKIAERSGVEQFTTHTLRHLCLTDLARNHWDIHQIAAFAGHKSISSTQLYIHLSGRDLAEKLERGMAAIHSWRISMIATVLK